MEPILSSAPSDVNSFGPIKPTTDFFEEKTKKSVERKQKELELEQQRQRLKQPSQKKTTQEALEEIEKKKGINDASLNMANFLAEKSIRKSQTYEPTEFQKLGDDKSNEYIGNNMTSSQRYEPIESQILRDDNQPYSSLQSQTSFFINPNVVKPTTTTTNPFGNTITSTMDNTINNKDNIQFSQNVNPQALLNESKKTLAKYRGANNELDKLWQNACNIRIQQIKEARQHLDRIEGIITTNCPDFFT